MLDDPTECYKFYWFDSIMLLLSQNQCEMTFDDIIIGMIADFGYSVGGYHLRFRTKGILYKNSILVFILLKA